MSTHLKTIGLMLIVVLWMLGVILTEGVLLVFTMAGLLLVVAYCLIFNSVRDYEQRNKNRRAR